MTDHERNSRQIIEEWLGVRDLGNLLGLRGDSIKHRIARGVYRDVRKVRGKGGFIWQVHVSDQAVPPEIMQLWESQVRGMQPQCFVSIRVAQMLTTALEDVSVLLRELLKQLKEIERPR
jgi:hypothetical protein